jgi:hypothetical protein
LGQGSTYGIIQELGGGFLRNQQLEGCRTAMDERLNPMHFAGASNLRHLRIKRSIEQARSSETG